MNRRNPVIRMSLACFCLLILANPHAHLGVKAVAPLQPDSVTTAFGQLGDSNVELISHLGGMSQAIFAQGNNVFVGFGPELAILDISDPSHPARVSSTLFADTVFDIFVLGDYAYIANASQGLYIFDVSNPTIPIEVGRYSPQGMICTVWVVGDVAYVGFEGSYIWKLIVLNVSDPSSPLPISFVEAPDSFGRITCIVVDENSAYVYHSDGEFFIIDISTIIPTIIRSKWATIGSHGFVISGDYAFFDDYFGLCYLEISDPGYYGNGCMDIAPLQSVAITDHYVYGVGEGGLYIVDIMDLASPTLLSRQDIGNYPASIVVSGDSAFVGGVGSLSVLNIITPTNPTEIGFYGLSRSFSGGIAVTNEHLYLTSDKGLLVLDTTDLSKPVEVGFLEMVNPGNDLAVAGNFAYVTSSDGFHTIDISDPSTPFEIGYVNSGAGYKVRIGESHAYIVQESGMQIIDISNPASPLVMGFYSVSIMRDLALKEPYAFVTNFDPASMDLEVIDVSDPMNPNRVGICCSPNIFVHVAVAGEYAYVTGTMNQMGGLKVLDISNPFLPFEMGAYFISPDTYPGEVAASGSNVYFLDTWWNKFSKQLRVLDVSDPSNPIETGFYNLQQPTHIEVSGRYIYIVTGDSNLYILRYTGLSIFGKVTQTNGSGYSDVTFNSLAGVTFPSDESGTYSISELPPGTYTITPTLPGYTFWPISRTVTLPPNANNQNFTILPLPVSTVISPAITTTLGYTDTQGLPTSLVFPPSAVTQTIMMTLTPIIASSGSGYHFTGHAFELAASSFPSLTFTAPVTITIHYSDTDVHVVSDESHLTLWWWDGSGWADAESTCAQPLAYSRDTDNNVLTVSICQTGRYALYGPTYQLFVPIVWHN